MKYVLFGAGYFCREAVKEYGKENILCIWDNDSTKHGLLLDGIPIVEYAKRERIYEDFRLVVCTTFYGDILKQLKEDGIHNYEIYYAVLNIKSYYSPKTLINNPYENNYYDRDLNESEWLQKNNGRNKKDSINAKVAQLKQERHMFHHVEIETVNRCNGVCSFCPVSVKNEQRPYTLMDEAVFKKIIDELSDLGYSGRLALFSNNEPLLDKRILEFHKYARTKCPKARMHLFTNGTLMTKEIFEELLVYLDELIIDNYNQNLELIPASKMIKDYAEEHPNIVQKVTIVLRKPNEILTSRGGDAPNRTDVNIERGIACIYPFQQLIIRPDGKVSLCCNDPLGKCTMGDASKESLVDIWYGEKFEQVRQRIIKGRENFEHCKNCDTFALD